MARADGTASGDSEDALYLSLAYEAAADPELAAEALEVALEWAEAFVEANPQGVFGFTNLALAHAMHGDRDQALDAIGRVEELAAADRFVRPWNDHTRAWVLARLGEQERAVEILGDLLTLQYDEPMTLPILRLDPEWDLLRDNPSFQQLIEESGQ